MRERTQPASPRFLFTASAALLAGCSLSPPPPPPGTSTAAREAVTREAVTREAVTREATARATDVASADNAGSPATPVVDGPISVNDAVTLALTHHPDLVAARARVESAIGKKLQAGAFPNPVFSAGMELAPFSGKTTGNAEYPIGVVQRVPIGGRLDKAVSVEEAREKRLLAEFERQRREVERQVRGAFGAALFARDTLAVERERFAGAGEAAQIASERLAAGDVAPDEQARAHLEMTLARIALRQAEVSLKRARIELRGTLGLPELSLNELQGELEAALALPDLKAALARLEESPVLLAQVAAVEESHAQVLREEAQRIPDIDIGFFYRRLEETGDNAFDVGISMPIPIFDRRRGALQSARAERMLAEAEYRKTGLSLATSVQTLYWKLSQELETAEIFREELLPQSEIVLRAADERFGAGAISLAELLPIRREHRELQLSYLSLLRQIATDWAHFRSLVETVHD